MGGRRASHSSRTADRLLFGGRIRSRSSSSFPFQIHHGDDAADQIPERVVVIELLQKFGDPDIDLGARVLEWLV
jgi:hypothetical protein